MDSILISKIKAYMDQVDSRYQMEFAREYAEIGDNALYGGKHAGSEAETMGAGKIAQELKRIGVQNVECIPLKTTKFQFNDAELTIINEPYAEPVKPYALTSPGTSPEGIEAELIDAGLSKKEFYQDHDVAGKIVLVEAMGVLEGTSLSAQIMQAEVRGAVGVIAFATEDVLNEDTIRVQALNHISGIPVVEVSVKDGMYLRQKLKEVSGLRVCLKSDTEFKVDGGISYSVVGEIPGETEERIFFSSHLDHYFRCMQDNIASVATLLGIAKGMLDSGYQPKRTITFIFNGSHETGMAESRYPYISGSYRLLNEVKKDWCGSTVLDINFEYSALELDHLTAFGSHEINRIYNDFLAYVPKEMPGFRRGTKPANLDEYLFLSWADTISYISNGIPTFMNDSLHEQVFEESSPYIGRDHSNHDNLEVFSENALSSCTKHFGALGIYVDNLQVMPYNFSEKLEAVALTEEEKTVSGQLGVDFDVFRRSLSECKEKAEILHRNICEFNKKERGTEAGDINRELLKIYRCLTDTFDKISPHDHITTAHGKYLETVHLLSEAKEALQRREVKTAIQEILPGVDLVGWARYFDRPVVEFAKDTINSEKYAHRRLWAGGKELSCLTLYDTMQRLQEKSENGILDYRDEIIRIEAAMDAETGLLRKSFEMEALTFKEVSKRIDAVNEML